MTRRTPQTEAERVLMGYCEHMRDMRRAMRRDIDRETFTLGEQPPRDGFVFDGIEDFLLQRATFWTKTELPQGVSFGAIKQCYDNALHRARRHSLLYVEGLSLGVIPVNHAWCGSEQGACYEVTWNKRIIDNEPAYLGVAFPLKHAMRARRLECSVLDNWRDKWPVLRGVIEPKYDTVGGDA